MLDLAIGLTDTLDLYSSLYVCVRSCSHVFMLDFLFMCKCPGLGWRVKSPLMNVWKGPELRYPKRLKVLPNV